MRAAKDLASAIDRLTPKPTRLLWPFQRVQNHGQIEPHDQCKRMPLAHRVNACGNQVHEQWLGGSEVFLGVQKRGKVVHARKGIGMPLAMRPELSCERVTVERVCLSQIGLV